MIDILVSLTEYMVYNEDLAFDFVIKMFIWTLLQYSYDVGNLSSCA